MEQQFPPGLAIGKFLHGNKNKRKYVFFFSSNKRSAFELQFHLIVNLFKNVCERS